MPAAGMLCCALSNCSLFSRSQPSLMVTPSNLSGNSVFGIEHFNLWFWECVADAGKLHLHVFELLEPAALLQLPCLMIHNPYKSEQQTIAHAYCVVFVSCAEWGMIYGLFMTGIKHLKRLSRVIVLFYPFSFVLWVFILPAPLGWIRTEQIPENT